MHLILELLAKLLGHKLGNLRVGYVYQCVRLCYLKLFSDTVQYEDYQAQNMYLQVVQFNLTLDVILLTNKALLKDKEDSSSNIASVYIPA